MRPGFHQEAAVRMGWKESHSAIAMHANVTICRWNTRKITTSFAAAMAAVTQLFGDRATRVFHVAPGSPAPRGQTRERGGICRRQSATRVQHPSNALTPPPRVMGDVDVESLLDRAVEEEKKQENGAPPANGAEENGERDRDRDRDRRGDRDRLDDDRLRDRLRLDDRLRLRDATITICHNKTS